MIIQAMITSKNTLGEIAERHGVSKSTISRELKKNTVVKPGSKFPCQHKSPLDLCNGCPFRGMCTREKRYYNFQLAQETSDETKVSSRNKSRLTPREIEIIDKIITPGIASGQSLYHIYLSNPQLAEICSERTIRRVLYKGVFSIGPSFLRRYPTLKHSKIKQKCSVRLRDLSILVGRTYEGFQKIRKQKRSKNYAQFDNVIGKITDESAMLTIHFPKYNFQFGLLIKKSDPTSVRTVIKNLFKKIGTEKVIKNSQLISATMA